MKILNIHDQLYEKVKSNFESFLDGLKLLNPEDIIEKAYETHFKREIYEFFESGDFLSDADVATLLSSNTPLQVLYEGWQNEEPRYLEHMRDSIVDTIREMPRIHPDKVSDSKSAKPSIIERLKNGAKKAQKHNTQMKNEKPELKKADQLTV